MELSEETMHVLEEISPKHRPPNDQCLEHYTENLNKLGGTFKKREQTLTAALRKQLAESHEMARKEEEMIPEAMKKSLAEDLGISVDDVKIFVGIAEKIRIRPGLNSEDMEPGESGLLLMWTNGELDGIHAKSGK